MKRIWANRWMRASAAAVIVAMWPACVMQPDPDHEDAAVSGEGIEYANLSFTMTDMHGNDVRLADFKGKPLVINFWATWCAPCKVEIPAFVELTEKYRAQGLTIVGISVDDPIQDLKPFADEFEINYPILVGLGRQDVLDAYAAGLMLPETWFIRPDGSVYIKHLGPQTHEWFEEQIQTLIASPAPAAEDGTR
jgi:peroxiredoxin